MSKPLQCRYCRRSLLRQSQSPTPGHHLAPTRDHVIPKSRGGTFTAWCCHQCNQLKADMSLIEWAKFMQAYPQWWERFRTHGQIRREQQSAIARIEWASRCQFRIAAPPICRGLAA